MPLIIDCYNLLHQPMPPSLAGLDEQGLCRALAASHWAADHATIVCDGSPKPGAPAGSPVAGVSVLYSGPRRSADDLIRCLLHKSSAPRRVTVVTNDRELRQAARRRRARVLSCAAFIHSLARPAAAPPAADGDCKPGIDPADLPDAEQWARRFGLDPHQSLDDDAG